ncbi:MAG: hypothetical protein HQM12_02750 [SAR324 cluster bacterium]|nr:hypothetical protein [SAR324 cluster bacterium]MBF0349451.1 hypothetical protein [SAR324 cluster bacterium]
MTVIDAHQDTEEAISPELIADNTADAVIVPNNKMIVKVYGLIGYTRCLDLQFENDHVIPENIFIFEKKRYKIASVIEMSPGQLALNAVSVEYST